MMNPGRGGRNSGERITNEQRLDQLREEAWEKGVIARRGVDVAGGPIPRKSGYYGQSVLKPPVWTWEIPVYFFIGGLSGMAAAIAFVATLFHHAGLARMSIFVGAIGGILSPILLTIDLGRPRLFINMLRVFKYKSPMSVGAWIVFVFSACAIPACIAFEIHAHQIFTGTMDQVIRIVADLLIAASAIFGIFLATYTGVLLGVTAIPAWFLHRVFLPVHFGAVGLGSAAALIELLGYRVAPLNCLGFVAAIIISALWLWLEIDKHGAADRALHTGPSGWLIRSGEFLSGPLALLLRGFGLIPLAGISFLLGAFVSRFGWIEAGEVCARDPEAVFASQSER